MSNPRSDEHSVAVSPPGPATGDSALPPGTRIHEFRILRLIGEGGFGIVYLAHDESLDRTVALKEYMPSQLAARVGGTAAVQVRSQRHADTFEAGLRSFINEAKLLARFDHPSLLKVYRFFQDNGTAYMAMPFYEGQTLKAVLRAMSAPPDEAWLRRLLYPVLDALEVLHRHDCYHRDIAPDNIMLQNDTPILLDFGAARRVIGDITQSLTVILKPGYAPIEQYGEDPRLKQGPWTDLYALASVVYFALTRQPPAASIARAMTDQLVPLAERLRGAYSEGFLRAIDAALSVRPEDRPQSAAEMRAMLVASEHANRVAAPAPAAGASAARAPAPAPRAPVLTIEPIPRAPPKNRMAIAGLALAIPAAVAAVWWAGSRDIGAPPAAEVSAPKAPAAPEGAQPAAAEPARVSPAPLEQAARVPSPPPSPPVAPPVAAAPPVERPQPARVEPAPQPSPLRTDVAKAKAPEPTKAPVVAEAKPPRVTPPAPAEAARAPVEAQPAPRPSPRAEEVVVEPPPPPRPPPQQVPRVDPKPEPAPPAKAEPVKPPVEVARVEPRPAAPSPQPLNVLGRYTGRLMSDGMPVTITLQILSVADGGVSATVNQSSGRCEGDYRMTGTLLNDALRMRSTHSGGRYGDCSFAFRASVQGAKLVGQTSGGAPLELSR